MHRTGLIRVTTTYTRASSRRIYRYDTEGRFNDEFVNYCINKGKELYSANHGDLYCVQSEASFTYREPTLLR